VPLSVSLIRAKALTNMRSAGADEKSTTSTPLQLTLEDAVEYVIDGEYVEVTPDAIRMGMAPKMNKFGQKV
jgi:GTP-binding protein